MAISILLRLFKGAIDAGTIAGEAEVIATGERRPIRSSGELIAFLTDPSIADSTTRSTQRPADELSRVEQEHRGGQ